MEFDLLVEDTKLRVTNMENGISANFYIDKVCVLGIPFLCFRVLREISIGAALSDEWYFLGYLKRKEIDYEIIGKI